MTYLNPDNQTHLVRFKERGLIDRLVQCIQLCASRLPRHPAPSVAWSQMQAVVDVTASQPTTTMSSSTTATTTATTTVSIPELQSDQQTLLACLLGIFRLFVNISHNGKRYFWFSLIFDVH